MSQFYDQASLVMIPSGYKAGKVYSQKPLTTDGQLTFTRTGDTATRVNADGLVEKVRTNLILQSNSFDTSWVNSNSTETSGQSGYDGTSNAWLLDKTGANGYIGQTVSYTGLYTQSIYVKAGTSNWLAIQNAGIASSLAYFDLQNGVIGGAQANVLYHTITSIGSGWYRCSTTYNGASGQARFYVADSDGVISGTSGNIYIQDAQLETGDIATQYIPTTTAAVSVGPVANLPRIDYTGGGCGKLLLEPQRTNLNPYSEQFDNAGWEKTYSTITANATTSPDGYTNADAWLETSDNNWHRLYDNGIPVTSGTAYTCSLFVKPNGRDWVSIEFFAGGGAFNGSRVWFNIANGTIGTTQTGITAKIENYGNGWYRISATQTAAASTTGYILYLLATGDGVVTYAGDPTKGAYVYGGMTEAGSYATSYIPTLAASVTRGADACSKTGISSLIGQTQGTLFVEAKVTLNGRLLLIGTAGNFIEILVNSAGKVNGFVRTSVTEADILSTATYATGDTLKIALAYKVNDFALYVNGTAQGTDTSGNVPTGMAQLIVNDYLSAGFNSANAYSQALLFKTRLTNAQLAELTTL